MKQENVKEPSKVGGQYSLPQRARLAAGSVVEAISNILYRSNYTVISSPPQTRGNVPQRVGGVMRRNGYEELLRKATIAKYNMKRERDAGRCR